MSAVATVRLRPQRRRHEAHSRLRGACRLVTTPVLQTGKGEFDPLAPHHGFDSREAASFEQGRVVRKRLASPCDVRHVLPIAAFACWCRWPDRLQALKYAGSSPAAPTVSALARGPSYRFGGVAKLVKASDCHSDTHVTRARGTAPLLSREECLASRPRIEALRSQRPMTVLETVRMPRAQALVPTARPGRTGITRSGRVTSGRSPSTRLFVSAVISARWHSSQPNLAIVSPASRRLRHMEARIQNDLVPRREHR